MSKLPEVYQGLKEYTLEYICSLLPTYGNALKLTLHEQRISSITIAGDVLYYLRVQSLTESYAEALLVNIIILLVAGNDRYQDIRHVQSICQYVAKSRKGPPKVHWSKVTVPLMFHRNGVENRLFGTGQTRQLMNDSREWRDNTTEICRSHMSEILLYGSDRDDYFELRGDKREAITAERLGQLFKEHVPAGFLSAPKTIFTTDSSIHIRMRTVFILEKLVRTDTWLFQRLFLVLAVIPLASLRRMGSDYEAVKCIEMYLKRIQRHSGQMAVDENAMNEYIGDKPLSIHSKRYATFCENQFSWLSTLSSSLHGDFQPFLLPVKSSWQSEYVHNHRAHDTDARAFIGLVDNKILTAPLTSFNPGTTREVVDMDSVTKRYLLKNTVKTIWGNSLVLAAGILAERHLASLSVYVSSVMRTLTSIQQTANLSCMSEFDPNYHIGSYLEGKFGSISDGMRLQAWNNYLALSSAMFHWLMRIPEPLRSQYAPYILRPVSSTEVARLPRQGHVRRQAKERRKNRVEDLQKVFVHIDGLVWGRFNFLERLHLKVRWYKEQIAKDSSIVFPIIFDFIDRKDRYTFALWTTKSIIIGPSRHVYSENHISNVETGRHDPGDELYLEYRGMESKDALSQEPWFIDLLRNDFLLWSAKARPTYAEEFCKKYGYGNESFVATTPGILRTLRRSPEFLNHRTIQDPIIFSVEPLYIAAQFGRLAVFLACRNGPRISEIAQAAFDPELCYEIDNFGNKPGRKQTVMLWYVKERHARKTIRENFISKDVKRFIVSTAKMVNLWYKEHPTFDPELKRGPQDYIPAVSLNPMNPHRLRTKRHRYLFQLAGANLPPATISSCMRFMVHGIQSVDESGQRKVVTNHDFRHAFANHMVHEEKIPIDMVASILHQSDVAVTSYYSQPTPSQIAETIETAWTRKINYQDIPRPGDLTPEEFSTKKEAAEQRVGVLAGVLGGECSYHSWCKNQMRCLGCAYHIPDPERRSDVQREVRRIGKEITHHAQAGNGIQTGRFREDLGHAEQTLKIMDMLALAQADQLAPGGLETARCLESKVHSHANQATNSNVAPADLSATSGPDSGSAQNGTGGSE